ncbi:MAG: HlyD family secretion protein [Thermosulfidibacteraceae bacterium]|jgi:membrane fusion protein (multidrug efflux system)
MNSKKKKAVLILFILTIILLILLVRFIYHRMRYAVTDAVFVKTDRMIYLSFPKISGKIKNLYKNEGDYVKAGEVVAELDCRDYDARVKQLENILKASKEKTEGIGIEKDWLVGDIKYRYEKALKDREQLKAELQSLRDQRFAVEAQLKLAEKDLERFKKLFDENLVSKRDLENAETQVQILRNTKSSLVSKENSISKKIEALDKEIDLILNEKKKVSQLDRVISESLSTIESIEAQLEEAKIYQNYCKLKAPIDGHIAKKFHSEGDVVSPGDPIYAIVDPKEIYILVLLEENKMKGVKRGCIANIKLDAYPNEKFEGMVEEILPATAAEFALVPRDISAGEFTKLAQRVPVKIKVTKGNIKLLRVGLGGEVEIKREDQ